MLFLTYILKLKIAKIISSNLALLIEKFQYFLPILLLVDISETAKMTARLLLFGFGGRSCKLRVECGCKGLFVLTLPKLPTHSIYRFGT